MKLIASNELSSTATSVTFSSIPATYTDLYVVANIKDNGTGSTYRNLLVRFNEHTGNNYMAIYLGVLAGTAGRGYNGPTNYLTFANAYSGSQTEATYYYSPFEMLIGNYTKTSHGVPVKFYSAMEYNHATTATRLYVAAGHWNVNATVTSVSFYPEGVGVDSFSAGSKFYLYGLKNN